MRRWEALHRCIDIAYSGCEWIYTVGEAARVLNSTDVSTGTFNCFYRHWLNRVSNSGLNFALVVLQLAETCGSPYYKSQNRHSLNTIWRWNLSGAGRLVIRYQGRYWNYIGVLLKTKQVKLLRWNWGNSLRWTTSLVHIPTIAPSFVWLKVRFLHHSEQLDRPAG